MPGLIQTTQSTLPNADIASVGEGIRLLHVTVTSFNNAYVDWLVDGLIDRPVDQLIDHSFDALVDRPLPREKKAACCSDRFSDPGCLTTYPPTNNPAPLRSACSVLFSFVQQMFRFCPNAFNVLICKQLRQTTLLKHKDLRRFRTPVFFFCSGLAISPEDHTTVDSWRLGDARTHSFAFDFAWFIPHSSGTMACPHPTVNVPANYRQSGGDSRRIAPGVCGLMELAAFGGTDTFRQDSLFLGWILSESVCVAQQQEAITISV